MQGFLGVDVEGSVEGSVAVCVADSVVDSAEGSVVVMLGVPNVHSIKTSTLITLVPISRWAGDFVWMVGDIMAEHPHMVDKLHLEQSSA